MPRPHLAASRGSSRLVLVAALTGVFATSFPIVILAASLGPIAEDFDASDSVLAWVIAAPLLASSVLMPILGKVGDLRGHRRVFLAGVAGASVLAMVTALSWSALSLIGLRTLGTVVGASTQPTSLAMIMAAFRPHQRARAMGYWSFVSAGAPTVGLIAGAPLVDAVGWRALFVVQGALSLGALLLAALVLEETARAPRAGFDVAGAATLTAASGGALFALNRAGAWGLGHPMVTAAAVVAIAGTAAFVRVERRARGDPLLPLELVAQRAFGAPVTAEFFMQAATMGAFTLVPLMLRSDFDYSVTTGAAVLLPLPLGMSVLSPIGGRAAATVGERGSAVAGGVVLGTGMAALAVGATQQLVLAVAVGLALVGAANGIARPSLTASSANSLHDGYMGVGVAAVRMLSQLGAATGITVLVMVRDSTSYAGALGAGVVLAVLSTAAAVAVTSRVRP